MAEFLEGGEIVEVVAQVDDGEAVGAVDAQLEQLFQYIAVAVQDAQHFLYFVFLVGEALAVVPLILTLYAAKPAVHPSRRKDFPALRTADYVVYLLFQVKHSDAFCRKNGIRRA